MKHEHETLITCPHCGYKDKDSWEHNDSGEEFDMDCPRCGLEFTVSLNIEVTYSTQKIQCKDGQHAYITKSVHCKDRDFVGGITKWVDLPKDQWEYYLCQECSICDHETFPTITKEQYDNWKPSPIA